MKNNIVQIYLGSKDSVIDTWFDLCKDQNTSYIVQVAMLYYFKTGEYLPLGNISVQKIYMGRVRRVVYLSKELKELREYISKAEGQGEKLGALFKRVLRQGIKVDPEKPSEAITEIEAENVLSKLRSYKFSPIVEEPKTKELHVQEEKPTSVIEEPEDNTTSNKEEAPAQEKLSFGDDFMLQFLSSSDIENFDVN